MKKTNKDNWNHLNDITKHVIGSKITGIKKTNHIMVSFASIILMLLLIVSVFFASIGMQNAFNMGNFQQRLKEESIVIDMNKVDIMDSPSSLRLAYFQTETKNQVFELLKNDSWWKNVLSTDINQYDFSYYDKTGTQTLDKSLIQTDGFTYCQLKVNLKNWHFEIKIPVIVQIKNTAKFYQKFMIFNHFEYGYTSQRSGINPSNNNLLERKYNGYLNPFYHYSKNKLVNNTTVYNTITQQINNFMNDYQQEFAPTSKIFPILSTIPLGDIDIRDEQTFEPYLNLVRDPNRNYVGNNVRGNNNQYFDLLANSMNNMDVTYFYISYVSNPNVITELFSLNATTTAELITYFKSNPLDYIPFSNTQKANDNNITTSFAPPHLLTVNLNGKYFLFYELDYFFVEVNSIKNQIINLKPTVINNINQLANEITINIWTQMLTFLRNNSDFFILEYPKPNDIDDNWTKVTTNISNLQQYFINIMEINAADLTTIQYLDANHNILNPLTITNTQQITNIIINIGPEEIDQSKIESYDNIPIHSFNYFLKVNWI